MFILHTFGEKHKPRPPWEDRVTHHMASLIRDRVISTSDFFYMIYFCAVKTNFNHEPKKKLRGLFRTTYNQLLVYVNVSLQYILPKEKQLTVKKCCYCYTRAWESKVNDRSFTKTFPQCKLTTLCQRSHK